MKSLMIFLYYACLGRVLISTPRWYSFGGMYESLRTAYQLAYCFNKKLVFVYPKNHVKLGQEYTAFLNDELCYLENDSVEVIGGYGSLISCVLTKWVEFTRAIKYTILGKGLYKIGVGKVICKGFLGYSGIHNGKKVSAMFGLTEPVDFSRVYSNAVTFSFNDKQKQLLSKQLKNIGLSSDSKFVCLFVRDNGFEKLKTTGGSVDSNANISRCYDVVRALVQAGYKVVRMGDPLMDSIEKLDGFIDYAHSKHATRLLDLYLYMNCSFWIGTMGGARFAPMFFRRPCIVINAVKLYFSAFCLNADDIFIAKHVFSFEKKRFLSLKEQLNCMDELPSFSLVNEKYIYVENSGAEIYQAYIEFDKSRNNDEFDWNSELQNAFFELKDLCVKKFFYRQDTGGWIDYEVEQYHHLRPKVSPSFLENCWDYGPYLQKLTNDYINRKRTADHG